MPGAYSSNAAVLRAVSRGDLPAVQRLYTERPKNFFDVHGPDGTTPLLLACKRGHLNIVKFLAKVGCPLSQVDKDAKRQGNTLHYASWGGHIELVRWLLADGTVQLDSTDVVGNTPLLYAVYGGHQHIVEEYVRRGRSLREHNNKNHTVILQAACGGHLDLVKWLLTQGFSLQETDNDGNTALLFAAWGGHFDLIQYLLNNGSELDEQNHNGHSVFLSAANGGRVEVVEWLLKKGFSLNETNNNGDTALLLAAYGGHRRLVERLLQVGASLKDTNGCGFTPLLSAANGGQLEMTEWLLEKGSKLDERDNDGYTALILAACGGSIELVQFLLDNGASLSEKNNNGDTALLLAAYCGHRDLVEWLLDQGSSLQEQNNTGMGVLISAANGGHLDVVQTLVDRLKGQGLEETDEGGYTPLLLAAQRGHMGVVQYLAARGANLKARTARHDNDAIALAVDFPEVQEYLRYIQDFDALQVACDARMLDRVHEMLLNGADTMAKRTPSLIEIVTTQGPYPDAPEACPRLEALVKEALRKWRPETHFLFGKSCRRSIENLFKVQSHLNKEKTLPALPNEIWMHIATFVDRSWYPQENTESYSAWSAPNRWQANFRRRWRNKYTNRTSETVEPLEVSDDDDDDEAMMEVDDNDDASQNGADDLYLAASLEDYWSRISDDTQETRDNSELNTHKVAGQSPRSTPTGSHVVTNDALMFSDAESVSSMHSTSSSRLLERIRASALSGADASELPFRITWV